MVRTYGSRSAFSFPWELTAAPVSRVVSPQSERVGEVNCTVENMNFKVAKALNSSEKLAAVKRDLNLYDPIQTGYLSSSAATFILKQHKVPADENDRRDILKAFSDQSSRVNHIRLIEFFAQCKGPLESKQQKIPEKENHYNERNAFAAISLPGQSKHNAKPPILLNKTDVNLMREVKRFLGRYTTVIDALEKTLENSYSGKTIPNKQMKVLVDHHNFPLNPSLTFRCIQRCDPNNEGRVKWEDFISYLRRANGSIRAEHNVPSKHTNKITNDASLKTAETKVDDLHRLNSDRNKTTDANCCLVSAVEEDIKAAFLNSGDQARNNDIEWHRHDFSALGGRADVFTRVANALEDKSKMNQGMIACDDVRKLVNYYNVILDADLSESQVNSVLQKCAKHDCIQVQDFVKTFGVDIT